MSKTKRKTPGPIAAQSETPQILLEPQVMVRCHMSRSQIWKMEQAGRFPKRKHYGLRRIGWLAREIDLWLELGVDEWMIRCSSIQSNALLER